MTFATYSCSDAWQPENGSQIDNCVHHSEPPAYQTGKSKVTFTVPDDGTTFDIAMTSK